ncbi:response regulator transcription factor [Chitinophaga sp. G-6-1-13]|uniref:Response regulator transcription factor n=1 Tax=Chitinophaga fulva TaxID=2728842 RepID=A0A848GYY1_9BACT|nr:LytTR family DNA-binding domain-containing protein [Chitinophaga fulva]NML40838.1 response regulator transcription factor [Chitinophaga fulva]
MDNTLKCIIVDDEEGAHLVLKQYIKNLHNLELAESFYTAVEAMGYVYNNRVDLIFLDINMPGLSGLELLETMSDPPLVILTTAYREYALEGYKYRVVDYLVKPFNFQRFMAAIDTVYSRLRPRMAIMNEPNGVADAPAAFVMLKVEGEVVKVMCDQIIYVRSWGNYVKVVTQQSTYLSPMTTTEIEQKLDKVRFRRIHKSYIVAMSRIRKITGGQAELDDGTVLPIGTTYRRDLLDNFQ